MSDIRILNLYHKKSILVDIYRQSLLSRHMKGVTLFNVRHSKGGPFLSKTFSWMEYYSYVHIARMRLSLILMELYQHFPWILLILKWGFVEI